MENEQPNSIVQRLVELQDNIDKTQLEIIALQGKLEKLTKEANDLMEEIIKAPSVSL